jgi:2-polyprenyl-3-methyl-5-hydroxy-6-metoxy-1,4-benzoquinol methylase
MSRPSGLFPDLTGQKQYWDTKWQREQMSYPHEGALRRGEKIVALIAELGLSRPKILDLGCGTGWLTPRLAELGEAVGVDLSDEAIAMARIQHPEITYHAGDLFRTPIAGSPFDVVVSQEVIAHVPDQTEYLRRISGLLKPGGYLVITTPNKFVHDRAGFPAQPPEHIEQWLTRQALRRLLGVEFTVLKMTTVNPLGAGGILRLVNSYKLNKLFGVFLTDAKLRSVKEWLGFGWTTAALAQRRV